MSDGPAFLHSASIRWEKVSDRSEYPYAIPAVGALDGFRFGKAVTLFVGENGSGKSTLVEALAVVAGFNAEGGSRNFHFATRRSESSLAGALRVTWRARPATGFFFRAESFFNVATHIEDLDREPAPAPPIIDSYGGQYQHERSHGEAFADLIVYRFGKQGLYILDEPESALSPARQLVLLKRMHELVTKGGSQFIIATHSPMLMAYPGAALYELSSAGMQRSSFEACEHVQLTRAFLNDPALYLRKLFGDDE